MKQKLFKNAARSARYGGFAALFVAAGLAGACDKDEVRRVDPREVNEDHDHLQRATDEVAMAAQEGRNDLVASTRRGLDKLDRKLEELEDSIERSGQRAKAELNEDIADLKLERERLVARLEHANEVSRDEWDIFVRDTKQALDDIEDGYNEVLEDLKTDDARAVD